MEFQGQLVASRRRDHEHREIQLARFCSRISTYNLARNHVFYNVVSSLIPGAKSTLPIRARLVSFLAVLASLALLIGYSSTRGWTLPGVAYAGLLAVNFGTMNTVLEARGYGLIFLFAMLASVAFARWSQTQSRTWLNVMAITCVLGTYTLPFYVVFGGTSFLLSFLVRPSRDTFLGRLPQPCGDRRCSTSRSPPIFTGSSEAMRTAMARRLSPALRRWMASFSRSNISFPTNCLKSAPLSFVLLILARCSTWRLLALPHRQTAFPLRAVIVSIAAFLAFCLYCKIVPARVSSVSSAAPLAFLALLVTGSILTSRSLASLRPFTDVCFTALVVVAILKSEVAQPLIPRSDWRSLGVLIERAFPSDTRISMVGDNPASIAMELINASKASTPMPSTASRWAREKLVVVEGYTKTAG